jgi:WD40 repeat protein/uncharacterized caspase-like protein
MQNTEAETTETRTELPFGQHHAFIIGIDKYEQVSPLQTAVNDARKLAEVLARHQHFRVYPPLLNATGAEIRRLLEKTLAEKVGGDDRVVFYFAGHGIAADGEDGPAGYLVPADADPTDRKTFIPMEDLHKKLDELPCRHLLLVLDCCFSGAFKWSSQHRAIGTLMPKKLFKERFDRFIQEPAWQVITSAAYDQKALDVLKGTGKPTGDRGLKKMQEYNDAAHSPFALALFEGLAGAADFKAGQEGDGVITATELYAYIRDQIEPATIKESQRLRQTPGFFPLRKHDKGEFIFLHPKHRLNLPPIPKRNPYKGLQSFDEADKELFYGRDRVIKEMRAKAENNKLLVVSGASGTGKSSVIKAGLLPALREAGFRILPVIRPGVSPLASLEKGLKDGKVIEASGSLQDGAFITKLGEQKTVLLIDQYEELITRCPNPAEREQFDALLRKLLDEVTDGALKIILTVRADFEPQLDDGALKSLWTSGRCTVPPFSVEELKEVIVMPTIQEVLIFDPPELVDEIIEEVVQAPGALPLLSYTLSELYEAYIKSGRQDRALKKEDYDNLGGVMGALRTKADALYHSLDAGSQNTMRKIMLRMVSIEGELAGKRVLMDELIYVDVEENQRVHAVVDQLVEARLIVKGKDYIEPAHDALVRAWKTLIEWIQTVGKEKITLQNQLKEQAEEYKRQQKKKDKRNVLWHRDPRLGMMKIELANPRQWLNAKEISFIQKSLQLKKTIFRLWVGGIAAAFIVLLVFLGKVWLDKQKIKASLLTNKAKDELKTDNTIALRIAQAAYAILKEDWLAAILQHEPPPAACQILSEAYHSQKLRPFYAANFPHDEPVNSAVFSPDGRHILTASEGGFAKLWDQRGNLIHAFNHDGYDVKSAVFSPNGKQILTLANNIVRLWETNGKLVDSDTLKFGQAADLSDFSTDGMRILKMFAGSEDEEYRALIHRLKQEKGIYAVIPASNKQHILTISSYGTVSLCDGGGKPLKNIDSNAVAATFSSDGKRILTVSVDSISTIRFRDEQGNFLGDFKYKGEVNKAVFSPDGSQILTAAKDHTAKQWDFSQKFVHRLPQHGAVNSAVFSPNGKRMLTASFDEFARLWDEQGNLLNSLKHGGVVNSAVFSPDGNRILTAARDNTARLWKLDEARVVTLPHRGEVKSAIFSPDDGSRILTASRDSTARVWTANGAPVKTLRHHGEVLSAVFSPHEGRQILTVATDSTATLWTANGDLIKTFKHRDEIYTAVFSPDGKRILTAGADGTARLWAANGDSIRTFKHNDKVKIAAFSPDGRRILTANNIVKLWDEQGHLLDSLEHKYAVTSAVFSRDGQQILTASVDESAKLWNLQGELLANYGKHTLPVNSAIFSRDGKKIVTASVDGDAIIWWTPHAIYEWLKTAPVYRLTRKEEEFYEIVK